MGVTVIVINFIFLVHIYHSTGQVLPRETLVNETVCSIGQEAKVNCSTDEAIAVESVYFYYHPDCENDCCSFNSSHVAVGANESSIMEIRRQCSGKMSCDLKPYGMQEFESYGPKNASYIVFNHFCIPESRKIAVCSDASLKLQESPLYLTNENYPSASTGNSTCSCAIEVNTCSTNLTVYLLDVALYMESESCDQSIGFKDGRGDMMKGINCESYNNNNITVLELPSHYSKIDFNESASNGNGGYFFLGFEASGTDASISLTCSSSQESIKESICIDCPDLSSISFPNGDVSLQVANKTSYGARAEVSCNTGYETNTSEIRCLETGHWENTSCFLKDCGDPPMIQYGSVTLVQDTSTTYNSTATVVCEAGYTTKKEIITCRETGKWENTTCDPESFMKPEENMQEEILCDLNPAEFNCSNDEVIAINSLFFAYHPNCSDTCCKYNSDHEFIDADEMTITEILRKCSGKQTCSVDLSGGRTFKSSGVRNSSYAVMKYICIPASRKTSICSDKVLTSDGLPLYLTSQNYPGVTTGNSTCSCSLEVNSCQSSVTMHVYDVDLYYDNVKCEQSLNFSNGAGDVMESINCEEYNDNSITVKNLSSHYVKIDFKDDSTQNQEGFFLLGFKAAEEKVSFSLSCSFKPESVCIDCSNKSDVANGVITLRDKSNTSNGAIADVTCDTGYETTTQTVMCLETGKWENATCVLKDCGNVPSIQNAEITLVDDKNTTYGALADVKCNTGYETTKRTVMCLETGKWENATCFPKDCGKLPVMVNGEITLVDNKNMTHGATATVKCYKGYQSDNDVISCLKSGQWTTVTCTAVDCGTAQIENAVVRLIGEQNTAYGAQASVSCYPGYKSNSDVISCLDTGVWSTVSCTAKECGNPPDIEHGNINLTDASKKAYQSTARVICQKGYETKNQMVTCTETGRWENSSCTQIETHPKTGGEDDDNTSTILLAVFLPILFVGLFLLLLFFLWKYRKQGFNFSHVSKHHELVSFKNEEVLPAENVAIENEQNPGENQQDDDENAPPKDEKVLSENLESSDPDKIVKDENVLLQHEQQNLDSKTDGKNEEGHKESQNGQDSNVDSKNEENTPENKPSQDTNVVSTNETLNHEQQGEGETQNEELQGNKDHDSNLGDKIENEPPEHAIAQGLDVSEKKTDVSLEGQKDQASNADPKEENLISFNEQDSKSPEKNEKLQSEGKQALDSNDVEKNDDFLSDKTPGGEMDTIGQKTELAQENTQGTNTNALEKEGPQLQNQPGSSDSSNKNEKTTENLQSQDPNPDVLLDIKDSNVAGNTAEAQQESK